MRKERNPHAISHGNDWRDLPCIFFENKQLAESLKFTLFYKETDMSVQKSTSVLHIVVSKSRVSIRFKVLKVLIFKVTLYMQVMYSYFCGIQVYVWPKHFTSRISQDEHVHCWFHSLLILASLQCPCNSKLQTLSYSHLLLKDLTTEQNRCSVPLPSKSVSYKNKYCQQYIVLKL